MVAMLSFTSYWTDRFD